MWYSALVEYPKICSGAINCRTTYWFRSACVNGPGAALDPALIRDGAIGDGCTLPEACAVWPSCGTPPSCRAWRSCDELCGASAAAPRPSASATSTPACGAGPSGSTAAPTICPRPLPHASKSASTPPTPGARTPNPPHLRNRPPRVRKSRTDRKLAIPSSPLGRIPDPIAGGNLRRRVCLHPRQL